MPEQCIENTINEALSGNTRINALEFVDFLHNNGLTLERFCCGYWADKLYWAIALNHEYIGFILINGDDENNSPWIFWSNSGNYFEQSKLDESMKIIAYRCIDFCENCGSCSGGMRKIIFAKTFENVCQTTFQIKNPTEETLEFMRLIITISKNEAIKQG